MWCLLALQGHPVLGSLVEVPPRSAPPLGHLVLLLGVYLALTVLRARHLYMPWFQVLLELR